MRYGIPAIIFVFSVFIGFRALSSGLQDLSGALYKDASKSVDERVADLLNRMTIEEKIGQMALVEKNSVLQANDIAEDGIGALLSGGGGNPETNTPEGWLEMINAFQRTARSSRLGIPLLYGVDAVHGHNNVVGATIFPHTIGLGASHDADLVRRIGTITAEEISETGANWNFAPSVDVPQDMRWGRVYETFGSDVEHVSQLSAAYLEGLQAPLSDGSSIVGTAKHYLGSGAMVWGTSTDPNFHIDQGETRASEAELRATHLPPYTSAIDAGVQSMMVGHVSWQGEEMTASHYWLTDVLKGELGFSGFVVSDWNGVSEISPNEDEALITAVNAGVDMVMLPYDYKKFVTQMQSAIARGDISMQRVDDAVTRILRAKMTSGLFDVAQHLEVDGEKIGSESHRAVAREAVQKSLVLLQDAKHHLPLSKKSSTMIVGGSAADNIGIQCGGWTVEWQGVDGNWIPGTSILEGLKRAVSPETVVRNMNDDEALPEGVMADVGIAVVGEAPYAEGWGGAEHPALTEEDATMIARIRAASKKVIVIVVSGRPIDLSSSVHKEDTVVAAGLPGSEGEGIADVLFGDVPSSGTLPIAWADEWIFN